MYVRLLNFTVSLLKKLYNYILNSEFFKFIISFVIPTRIFKLQNSIKET